MDIQNDGLEKVIIFKMAMFDIYARFLVCSSPVIWVLFCLFGVSLRIVCTMG